MRSADASASKRGGGVAGSAAAATAAARVAPSSASASRRNPGMLPAGDHRSFQVRMLQVDSYNVNRPSAHFHVLLDNEVYGPFYRIRVRPLRLPHAHSPVVRAERLDGPDVGKPKPKPDQEGGNEIKI